MEAFSQEGDWVLDPFVGGGTTAVEALALGRNFVGSDINDLAIAVSKLKTTLLHPKDLKELDRWARQLNIDHAPAMVRPGDEIFFENIPPLVRNATRKIAGQILKLKEPRLRTIASGALLRLCQLELEHRLTAKSLKDMQRDFQEILNSNLEQSLALSLSVEHGPTSFLPDSQILKTDAAENYAPALWMRSGQEFKMVVTSPPYPERHILYHKWQVNGRTETRLPYWIIRSSQVEVEQFYTMGARDNPMSLEIYMSTMFLVFENLNRVMRRNGVIVQVVAFNKVAKQLPLYLAALNESGFEEIRNIDSSSSDGRLWRTVPNRRWFNRHIEGSQCCNEVVLFHRKK